MTIMPTMEGGLRLGIENPQEWGNLAQIAADALGDGDSRLAERLGALMDEESDWDEVVIPELRVHFSEQLGTVARAVQAAQQEGLEEPDEDGEIGEVFIKRGEAEEWYGALNQARLALESRFRFGPSDDLTMEGVSGFSAEKLQGFLRMRFYTGLQGVLLDYAME